MSGIFGGGSKIRMPDPIDPGKSMGEYLFGKGFESQYQGITDPRLQERLIGAEATYRPQYTALELADIGVMARGIEAGAPNPERLRLEAELAGLRAGAEVYGAKDDAERREELAKIYNTKIGKRHPVLGGISIGGTSKANEQYNKEKKLFIETALASGAGGVEERQAKIAELEARIAQMPETMEATPGLFDLLEEQSRRAGALQRGELQLQRESDVGALQEFAPQVVEAYRAADPYSTGLADLAQRQAETLYAEGEGELSPERRRMAEQAARMGSLARGRIGDESSIAAELLGREQVRSGLRAEARQAGGQAFGMQRQMAGDIGSVLLGRPSAAIGLGGQVLGQAQAGAAGPMGPQLFDPNVGINMALQQRGQDVTFQGMQAQAKAAGQAGIMGGLGAIGGGLLGNPNLF